METERRLVESGVMRDTAETAETVETVERPGPGRRQTGPHRRHRRKLPEIPKHRKRECCKSFRFKIFLEKYSSSARGSGPGLNIRGAERGHPQLGRSEAAGGGG